MDYKFSVIMPLYNVGGYLADTIDSVVQQTIGFEENIQIILVNDGSSDNTEQICLEFRDTFPDNITYVYQDNAGVSAARNTGIPYIRGKYVNFMDSDDLWGIDAFEKAWNMFEEYGEAIDVVSCRMDYFEGRTGYQLLDYKYDGGDLLCDIHEHPSYCQFSICSCFCRSEAIEGMSFDTRLTYGEDAKFINQLILEKEKYGLLADSIYHVRKRDAASSLTQSKTSRPTAYLDTANYYYKYLVDLSTEKFGRVIPYVQYALMNAIKYRVRHEIPDTIPPEISEPFINITLDIIRKTDDEVICGTNQITTARRTYLLLLKYGADKLKSLIDVKDGKLFVGENLVGDVFGRKALIINGVKRNLLKTEITGILRTPVVFDDTSLRAFAGSSSYDCRLEFDKSKCRVSYKHDLMNRVYNWKVTIPSIKCRDVSGLKWKAVMDGYEVNVTPFDQ